MNVLPINSGLKIVPYNSTQRNQNVNFKKTGEAYLSARSSLDKMVAEAESTFGIGRNLTKFNLRPFIDYTDGEHFIISTDKKWYSTIFPSQDNRYEYRLHARTDSLYMCLNIIDKQINDLILKIESDESKYQIKRYEPGARDLCTIITCPPRINHDFRISISNPEPGVQDSCPPKINHDSQTSTSNPEPRTLIGSIRRLWGRVSCCASKLLHG